MKKGCHPEEIGNLLNSLADGKLTGVFTSSLTRRNKRMVDSFYENSLGVLNHDFQNCKALPMQNMAEYVSQPLSQSQADVKIGEVMENLTKAVTNSQVDETLADIFDLNEYRMMANKRQIDALKTSLKAADQRISEAELINVNLETEVTKLNNMTKNLLRKIEVSEKELKEIKVQYHDSQDDNTEFRQNLLKEIAEKTKIVESLEEEKAKLLDKMHQYKERMIEMKNSIEEFQKANSELQKRLDEEIKQKTDIQTTLAKREEKLKKKERQIEEVSEVKETQEKELESVKKELTSVKQLNKRQEQAIQKKEKQIQEQSEEMNSLKTLQEQIFNLSKRAKK